MTYRSAVPFAILLVVSTYPVHGAEFCDDASNVSLETVLSHPDRFVDKRVHTRAVLRTDGKEYVTLMASELGRYFILTTVDDVSSQYVKDHPNAGPQNDLLGDFRGKLKEREGAAYKFDMSKIGLYRQDVEVCGRLIGAARDRYFAVDDMRVLGSYLLPEKPSRKHSRTLNEQR